MKYLTSYYWQQEEKSRTSLVLQHLVYRWGKVPVLFACLCSAEEEREHSYFAEQLSAWFQNTGRELLMTNRENEAQIIAQIYAVIAQIDKELADNRQIRHDISKAKLSVAGILCVADCYFFFYRGRIKAYLLNERFGRASCRKITEENCEELQILSGTMEKNIGLLLATEDFGKGLSEVQIRECLAVKALTGTRTCERHLQELGQVSEENGGRHMGAVLLVTE